MTPGSTPPAVLVVGAGLMGRWHAYEVRRAGGRVVGVVDPDGARGRRLADRARSRWFGSVDEAVREERPRIAHVCVPTSAHADVVHALVEAGCHVLAEKPLAETAAETESLLAAASARGVLLDPVHQFPFQRGIRRLLSAREQLGEPVSLRGVACSAGAAGGNEAEMDRVAGEILPHFLSLAQAFLGADTDRWAWRSHRPGAGELRAAAVVRGVDVQVHISMSTRPTRTTWEVAGSAGTGWADLFHGFSFTEGGRVSRGAKIVRPLVTPARALVAAAANLGRRSLAAQPAYPGLRELVRAFYAAAAGAGPDPVPPEHALAAARARDLILGR